MDEDFNDMFEVDWTHDDDGFGIGPSGGEWARGIAEHKERVQREAAGQQRTAEQREMDRRYNELMDSKQRIQEAKERRNDVS